MRRTLLWMAMFVTTIAGVSVYVGRVGATPAAGFTGTTIALGRFDSIDVLNQMVVEKFSNPQLNKMWASLQKTNGASDLYVQNNLWTPGGSTGWHTHPGHSLIVVTEGTVTAYEGDDPSCTPTQYTVGMGFVDPGGDHVHLLRNETSADARTVAVQLIPAGAGRRIDKPAPAACPVF